MAVGVVCSPTKRWKDADLSNRAIVHDDGVYSVLYPHFEKVRQALGGTIDPYESAYFHGDEIELFIRVLSEARDECLSRPEEWEERTGTMNVEVEDGTTREIRLTEKVKRVDVCQLIERLTNLARMARAKGLYLLCVAD